MSKHKVINNNDFLVGLRFQNTGIEKLIRKNAYIYLTDEEIQEINSASKLFQKGVIFVEEQEIVESLGYTEQSPNSVSEKEIRGYLELGNARMKKELSGITEQHAINKVVNVVKSGNLDLSQSKLKIIGDIFDVDLEYTANDELI